MAGKPDAPAARRNRAPICEVLKTELARSTAVLEIGSGTGQHAVWLGRELPWLTWQTSDLEENHPGIRSWIAGEEVDNVLPPLDLDVLGHTSVSGDYDAVFSSNTAHIMSMPAVEAMFRLAGDTLRDGGVFCLYGPFNLGGEFTSDSNREFDHTLRSQDPAMGLRDLDELNELAADVGLVPARRYAMPSNNLLVTWRSEGEGS